MMKTLLTGAGGLVGSTIPADIQVMGRKPPFPEYKEKSRRWCDLTNFRDTHNLFQETLPTHVIHTAAKVGGLGANLSQMGEFFYDNMLINLNVLEAARRANVTKVISFMSTCIFPDDVEYPITEDMLHNGEPHSSNFGYAYAKRMVDVQSRAYNEQYGVQALGDRMKFGTKYISVIPTNIYGPNDNFELENSHVVPAMIHKCYIAKRDRTPLVVWGSGKPLREFIYSEDVGRITQYLLENYEGFDPLILSTNEEHSIRDLVIAVADALDFQGPIIYDDNKPDGQYKKTTSNERLQRVLPLDFEFTPFREGIKKTVEWFVENYENCRK
jgi:GDP-L-fucose synthase